MNQQATISPTEQSQENFGVVKSFIFWLGDRQKFLGLEIVIFVCMAAFILWQHSIGDIFTTTTPTGGDITSHIWGPDFIKEELFPRFSGWTNDWFGGLPAFTFYPVIPHYVTALLSFIFHPNIAFKLATLFGVLALPPAAFYLGKMAGLKRPIPIFMSLFVFIFIYDDNYRILGGNILGNLAGEYSETWGLALCLFYFGTLFRGLETNRLKVWSAVLLALTVLCHPLTGMLATLITLFVLIYSLNYLKYRNYRITTWMVWTFGLGSLLSAFWVVPFILRGDYVIHTNYVKTVSYQELLFRTDLRWAMALALVGAITSIIYNIKLGKVLLSLAVVWALLFRFFYTGAFLVDRFLPLYYLSVLLLAALGLGILVRIVFLNYAGKNPLSEESKLFLKITSAVVYGGTLLILFLWFPLNVFGVGDNFIKLILSNSTEQANQFLRGLAVLSMVGVIGLTVTLLAIFLPDVKDAIRDLWDKDSGPRQKRSFPRKGVVFLAILVTSMSVFYSVGLQLRFFGWFDDGRFGVHLPVSRVQHILTTDAPKSFAPGWAEWNYTGVENKIQTTVGPGYSEFAGIVETMDTIGKTRGCGRALWEYQNVRQTSYGSSFIRNTFPYWTDGCISTIDGLYTESSATSPYYYISLSEVAKDRSEIIIGLNYVETNPKIISRQELFAKGVKHLQILGVNYYLAGTFNTINQAKQHPDLELLAVYPESQAEQDKLREDYAENDIHPHNIFFVRNSDWIVPLEYEPAVIGNDHWLERTNEWWVDPGRLDVFLLSDAPDDYQRLSFTENTKFPDREPEKIPLESVNVTDVSVANEKISFKVDRIGVPIMVKISYFPNWEVSGALGPYRASPNWMVVIPTSNEVVLSYGLTSVEYLGYGLTVLGIGAAVTTYIWDRKRGKIWEEDI